MKRSNFTGAQRVFEAVSGEVRRSRINETTNDNVRQQIAGVMPSEMKRMRLLEEENGKLKKIVADLSIDTAKWQDVIRRKF